MTVYTEVQIEQIRKRCAEFGIEIDPYMLKVWGWKYYDRTPEEWEDYIAREEEEEHARMYAYWNDYRGQ